MIIISISPQIFAIILLFLLTILTLIIIYLCQEFNERALRLFLIKHRKNESLIIKIAKECNLIEFIIEIMPEYENSFPKHTEEEWKIIRNKVNKWKLSEKSKNL